MSQRFPGLEPCKSRDQILEEFSGCFLLIASLVLLCNKSPLHPLPLFALPPNAFHKIWTLPGRPFFLPSRPILPTCLVPSPLGFPLWPTPCFRGLGPRVRFPITGTTTGPSVGGPCIAWIVWRPGPRLRLRCWIGPWIWGILSSMRLVDCKASNYLS